LINQHSLKWKFADDNGDLPSQEFLDQIIPLSTEASNYVWNFEMSQKYLGSKFLDNGYFKDGEEYDFRGKTDKEVKKWLYKRGIPFDGKVFWITHPSCGFVLTWKMLIKFWEDIFTGSDEIVWDKTLNWTLAYNHNEVFYFSKNRVYNSDIHSSEIAKNNLIMKEWLNKK